MNITVQIPDDLAERLGAPSDLSRLALEALALDAFRGARLTKPELGRLLGCEPAQIDDFLNRHGIIQLDDAARERARQAADRIIEMGKGVTLGGISIKELINEGRR